ncbi:MAG: hypothetical protein EBU90_12235 [Proteobacteria bacterium]|nr:hypothetical protein [Pseudomonadota bacterium]
MAKFLIKTAESAVKTDKNTKNYKTVTFTEAGFMETPWGLVQKPAAQCISTAINCYEENYLGKMDLGWADPIFNPKNPAAGGIFEGSIEQRNVKEYNITSADGTVRTVETYKTVVFGNTDSPSFESTVKAAFKSRGQEVVETSVAQAAKVNMENLKNIIIETDPTTVGA